jgi:hypothetical protein
VATQALWRKLRAALYERKGVIPAVEQARALLSG